MRIPLITFGRVQNEMCEKNPGVGFPGRFFFSTRYFERRVKALIVEVLLKAKNNNKSEKIALYHINLAIIIRNEK